MQSQNGLSLSGDYRKHARDYHAQTEGAATNARPMSGPAVADQGDDLEKDRADNGLGLGIPSCLTGLASLEVNLPVRGVEYLFTTLRGHVQITASSAN